jgi:hypothetical protein
MNFSTQYQQTDATRNRSIKLAKEGRSLTSKLGGQAE